MKMTTTLCSISRLVFFFFGSKNEALCAFLYYLLLLSGIDEDEEEEDDEEDEEDYRDDKFAAKSNITFHSLTLYLFYGFIVDIATLLNLSCKATKVYAEEDWWG